jgi:hypothetical protein
VQLPLLQAFPFPSTLGEVVLHLPSPAGVFIYSSHGKWVFPWGFPHTATFYKLSRSWLLGVCRHSCHLQPACCEYFPAPSLALRVPHPLCYVSFFVAVVVYSVCFFSLFSLGRGPGGYADLAQGFLWECHVPLSSLGGLHLLSQ